MAFHSRRLLAGSAIALCCGLQALAQQPAFRASVESVEVDVRVTDRDGRPVPSLTAADFELREDGKRQVISSATFVQLKSIPAAPTPAASDADTGSVLALDGRAYVIVLDDLHVEARWSSRVVTLVTQFIDRNVTSADRVSIRTTGGGAARTAFTGNKSVLTAAVSNFIGRKLPPASIEQSERRAQSQELSTWTSTDDPFERARAMQARAAMATLRDAANGLRELRGRRKAILFFSEGIDYDITDAIGRADKGSEADGILQAIRDAVGLANQTNTSFYAIDPRGSALNADVAATSFVDRDATDAMRRELMMSQASLREVAELTGGAAAVNTNNLAGFFEQVVQDGDSYYMLSYTPAPTTRRSAYHKIDVRVGKRGLHVRARPGYTSMPAPVASATTATAATGGAQPSVAETPLRPVAPAVTPPSVEPDDPDLDVVMERVAAYVGEYHAKLSGVVAEELYHQSVVSMSGPVRGRIGASGSERDLRSDLLLVKSADEDQWVQFRDVFEVDGRALRDRDERLYKLFVEPTPNARRQAEVIQEAGARYNIGPLMRTINVPILALGFLAEGTQPSFRYQRVKAGDLQSFAAVARADDIWVIEYRETAKETLIRGQNNRSIPSRGKVWIEASTGRVLRTELLSEDVQVKAEIAVDYRTQPGVDLLMPVEMREHYTLTQLYMRIEGRATYNRFRRFTVTTSEKPKPQ